MNPPRTVQGAVRLMCAGAVAELAAVVTMVVTTASVQAALAKEPGLTAAQWHAALSLLTFREVGAAVAVACGCGWPQYLRLRELPDKSAD